MDDLDKCTKFLNIEINGLGHLVKLGITYLMYSNKEQAFWIWPSKRIWNGVSLFFRLLGYHIKSFALWLDPKPILGFDMHNILNFPRLG